MRSLHFSHALFIIRGFSLLLFFCFATFGLLAQGSDALIDVDNLTKLNAIRYDLNGSGVADSVDDQSAYEAAFGTFDGNGHTISNLYVNHPSISGVGLFGVLGLWCYLQRRLGGGVYAWWGAM